MPVSTTPAEGIAAQAFGERTGYVLTKLGEVVAQLVEQALTPLGLTGRKFNLLTTAHLEPSLSQREVGVLLGLDPNVVGDLVDELEVAGLLIRRRNRTDRRRHELVLTSAGRGTLERADQHVLAAEVELLARLTGAEAQALHEHAQRILALA